MQRVFAGADRILREADKGTPVAEVCRKAGISDPKFYNWRKR
ncbi:MAG: hypothetical protein EOQ69_28725 [Mesorhizobium sp.]|nr:MAG: hypothetical protein EOQ69_28725 [Mesorhizobium sp.]